MRLRPLTLVGCALMAAAAPAFGQEASLEITQAIEGDSNVFRSADDPISDGIYKLTFAGELKEEGKRVNYGVRYVPTFRTYFKTSGLSGWDHFLGANGDYRFSPQDTIEASFVFQNFQAIRADTVFDASGQPQVVQDNDGRVQRTDADLTYRRSFGQRVTADLNVNFEQFQYTELLDVDNMALGGSAQVQYAVLERLTLGASFVGRYRAFEEQFSLPSSRATTLNANLIAAVDITPTLELSLSGGPSVIISRQETPTELTVSRWIPTESAGMTFGRYYDGVNPPTSSSCATQLSTDFTALAACALVPASVLQGRLDETVAVGFLPGESFQGESSRNSTYFLDFSLSKRFARSSVGASYLRTDDAGFGQGTVSVLDSVDVIARWKASDFWDLFVTGVWTRRESSSQLEQAVSSAVDNTEPGGALRSDPFTDSNGIFHPTGEPLAEADGLWVTRARNETDITQWLAVVRATRKLSKRMKIFGEFRYYRQSQLAIFGGAPSEFDNYTALVAFTYSFDPFRF